MAYKKTKKEDKKEDKKEYASFHFEGDHFTYSGRVYPKKEKGSTERSYFTLTLNEDFSISGCWLVFYDDKKWIQWPSYKTKDDEYQSYIFINKDMRDEIDALADAIANCLNEL